jgi:predicted nucleic acid-binding protein
VSQADEDARPAAILDTNVFVAAGFRRSSRAARIVEAIRAGRLRMAWNDATRREVERVLNRIPRLRWEDVAELFREEDRYTGETHPEQFDYVPDPADRPFAALADATGVPLVTADEHLLAGRARARAPILTPGEFVRRYRP